MEERKSSLGKNKPTGCSMPNCQLLKYIYKQHYMTEKVAFRNTGVYTIIYIFMQLQVVKKF